MILNVTQKVHNLSILQFLGVFLKSYFRVPIISILIQFFEAFQASRAVDSGFYIYLQTAYSFKEIGWLEIWFLNNQGLYLTM